MPEREVREVPCNCEDGPCEWKHFEGEPPVVDHRLRETGNGPTVNYEVELLRQYFGEPDADGVYGKGGDDERS